MSTDYDAGYKAGVEKATEPLYADGYYALKNPSLINEQLKERRKKLLTKKVTKWVNVYQRNGQLYVAPTLMNSETEAQQGWTSGPTEASIGPRTIGHYLNSFPIEIEIPL